METKIRNPLFEYWQSTGKSLKAIAALCRLSAMHVNRMVRYSPLQMSGVSFRNVLKVRAGTGIDMSSYAMLGIGTEVPEPGVRARVRPRRPD